MATNMIFKYSVAGSKAPKVRELSGPTAAGIPLLDPTDARPAVTLTATGNYTVTVTDNLPFGWTSVTGVAAGGESLRDNEATLAYDGTWEFSVAGADADTANGTEVFITGSGDLTLTEGSNDTYGVVDIPLDYIIREDGANAVVPVRIGG